MTTIVIISMILIAICIIYESLHLFVFGLLSSEQFNLQKHSFSEYHQCNKMLFSNIIGGKYLSRRMPSILSKWHTEHNCIPRWSKFHKEIENKYQQLLNQQQCQNDQ